MRKRIIIVIIAALFLGTVLLTASSWDGDITDHATGSQVEKSGFEPFDILPWSLEGDLLLFLFLAGGAVAGFTAGYYWRKLFSERAGDAVEESEVSVELERNVT